MADAGRSSNQRCCWTARSSPASEPISPPRPFATASQGKPGQVTLDQLPVQPRGCSAVGAGVGEKRGEAAQAENVFSCLSDGAGCGVQARCLGPRRRWTGASHALARPPRILTGVTEPLQRRRRLAMAAARARVTNSAKSRPESAGLPWSARRDGVTQKLLAGTGLGVRLCHDRGLSP